jgi:hypothetical protein
VDIYKALLEAATESQCLMALCGLSSALLAQTQQTMLPGIKHLHTRLGADRNMEADLDFGSDDSEDDGDVDEGDEAEELGTLISQAEDTDGVSRRTERQSVRETRPFGKGVLS